MWANRKTRRMPLWVFYNMLIIALGHSYTIHNYNIKNMKSLLRQEIVLKYFKNNWLDYGNKIEKLSIYNFTTRSTYGRESGNPSREKEKKLPQFISYSTQKNDDHNLLCMPSRLMWWTSNKNIYNLQTELSPRFISMFSLYVS